MSELYAKSIKKLELDCVLAMLSACAQSEEGKIACGAIQPVVDAEDVRALLEETSAACRLRDQKGSPSFSGIHNITDCVERADRGGCLNTKELLSIGNVLRCTRQAKAYYDDEQQAVLSWMFQSLTPNKFLEERIFNVILSEDEIADTASAELADIRRHMRLQSAKIKDSLQKVITSPAYSKLLREPIITVRQGRYVVPVKSECKNDLPGLVHDVSATGSTYFIEPMSVVNANNALRELELSEKSEIERLLSELSAAVAAHKEGVLQSYTMLVRLDVIFAKARLAEKMRASAPQINDQGIIELHNARHPLIDPEKVVPISVWIGKQFDTMIITGPNTGGKTVTLKTVGLLTLMAECGLHIPAGDGSSSISTFSRILADIGDEQSIAQSLSTFSSHMRTIVDIVDRCDSNTLVLFDELGAGTDPAEGAALAIALIEHCRKLGSRVIATTHYAELKLYAMRTEGVTNASCEFDIETLQPTYRLLIGFPGKSNAFAISKKLGLSEDIIKNASDLIGKNDKDFEDVLTQLEEQRRQMELARQEAEHLRRETEKVKQQSEAYNAQLRREREKAVEEARREARRIIDEARRTANETSEELKAIKKQLSEGGDTYGINQRQIDLRKKLNDAESSIRSVSDAPARPAPKREIMVGDTVELLKLGTKANVLAINKDGTYQLQAGILKLTAKANEIYLLETENPYKEKPQRPAHSGRQMNLAAIADEVDLRGMDSIEAVCVMERYLDEAMRANVHAVRIIHGKGTGVLRAAVHQALKKNRFVKKFRLGAYGEGEDGVTVVEFS